MRKHIILAAVTSLVGMSAVNAAPVTFSATASVTILEQIAINEVAALSFGTIDKPSAAFGPAVYTVNAVGSSNTGDGSFIAPGSVGTYTVFGSDGVAYTPAAAAGGCSDPNLSLSVSATSTNGNVLDDTLTISGDLTVSPDAVAGAQSCTYTVSASY